MQEKWNELQTVLEEMKTIKKREYFLTLAVCILSGLVLGMLLSPKKRVMIGSNNGNNNVGTVSGGFDDDGCCGDDCCCDCECEE